MRRVVYLCDDTILNGAASIGVQRKVFAQVKAMERAGIDCKIAGYKAPSSSLEKVLRRFPILPESFIWPSIEEFARVDALYIRNPGITSSFIQFLNRLKMNYPAIRIAIEFPSYPYDGELAGIKGYPLLLKEKYNRRKLSEYVDICFTYSDDTTIFGIPATHIVNGIDLSLIRVKSGITHEKGHINLVCVALFNRWHGIDRLLNGLHNYVSSYGDRTITIHLIGDGPALGECKRLTRMLSLEDSVVFYGRMHPSEFDYLYDECDAAIECLGIHRKGASVSSSLKSREYLAKGIPFIYSGEIDVFRDNPVDFCYQLPADETPVDICELIAFIDGLNTKYSPIALPTIIRSYAEEHVSMDAVIKPVVDYFRRITDEQ